MQNFEQENETLRQALTVKSEVIKTQARENQILAESLAKSEAENTNLKAQLQEVMKMNSTYETKINELSSIAQTKAENKSTKQSKPVKAHKNLEDHCKNIEDHVHS